MSRLLTDEQGARREPALKKGRGGWRLRDGRDPPEDVKLRGSLPCLWGANLSLVSCLLPLGEDEENNNIHNRPSWGG